ncbi:nicotinamide riboside transporter PnuC [Nicoliella spurrieriana]|uniref:Nicotinamide riboside transporter PnuC n=1 Tax=Nicoliella spurrieriana TaxID=2925830 RepID=A0A976RSC1_9LACO|nr:nicotinamide riboside transporter PnuC [Nicoliella spurrieriana]UQS86914.1 nicotinamide riboside transporter PnuC [Nicoliella spurrieriana]
MVGTTKWQIFKSGWHLASHPTQLVTAIQKMRRPLLIELVVLLILQVCSWFLIFNNNKFSISPDLTVIGLVSLFSGVTNIMSVVLDSDGSMTNFFWGMLNNVTYIYVSFSAHLYGEVYLYTYFFISQFIGIYSWNKRNLEHPIDNNNEVQVKELSMRGWVLMTLVVLVSWGILAFFLMHVPLITPTLDPHPWIDALSTVVQVFAQVLLICRYSSSQFILWIIGNTLEIILWTVSFNPIMIMLFIACNVNSFFGWYVWNQKLKQQAQIE